MHIVKLLNQILAERRKDGSDMTHNFKGKTIVLGAPTDFNFSEIIEQELRHMGFDVVSISYSRAGFKYKNIFQRLESFFHKNFLGQRDYKQRLCTKHVEEITMKRLEEVTYADYALLIRPDQYSEEVVNKIKQIAYHVCAYQWDGLGRFPAVKKYITWFDHFFVFDPSDVSAQSNLRPITNFYTESVKPYYDTESRSDAYYLGTYIRDRAAEVEDILTTLQSLGLHVKHHICYRGSDSRKFKHLDTTRDLLTYAQNLHLAYNTKLLIDVSNHVHKGLSFRTFEALGFGKKLITTNRDVCQYDFYHPNNIFIWGGHDQSDLEAFLNVPYIPVAQEIREKYSFSNWISYVFSDKECQAIELPIPEMSPQLA